MTIGQTQRLIERAQKMEEELAGLHNLLRSHITHHRKECRLSVSTLAKEVEQHIGVVSGRLTGNLPISSAHAQVYLDELKQYED